MGEIGYLCHLCELRKICDKRRKVSNNLGKIVILRNIENHINSKSGGKSRFLKNSVST